MVLVISFGSGSVEFSIVSMMKLVMKVGISGILGLLVLFFLVLVWIIRSVIIIIGVSMVMCSSLINVVVFLVFLDIENFVLIIWVILWMVVLR